jgi:peptidoglycan-N-acetylglucosamine deacetylase
LSIDLECWWCNEFLTKYLPDEREDFIYESLVPLLNLLDKHNTKATFFVLGVVAEKYPELIEELHKKGHEIASHGYSHNRLHKLGPVGFKNEIERSLNLLDKYNPIGFRAPSFSIDNKTIWIFEILEEYGFKYDSSIFPIKTMLYGVPNAPLNIYKPSKKNITEHDPNGKVVEFPLTVINFGKNIPIAGGFYLRTLPLWFIKRALSKVNKYRPGVIYIHPWETYSKTPRIKLPPFSKFEAYYGISSTLNKLDNLLNSFDFEPLKDVLKNDI